MHPYNIHDVYNTYTYIFDMMSFSNIFTLQNFIKNPFLQIKSTINMGATNNNTSMKRQ